MKYKIIAIAAGITLIAGIGGKLLIDKFVGDLFSSVFENSSVGINKAIEEEASKYSFNTKPILPRETETGPENVAQTEPAVEESVISEPEVTETVKIEDEESSVEVEEPEKEPVAAVVTKNEDPVVEKSAEEEAVVESEDEEPVEEVTVVESEDEEPVEEVTIVEIKDEKPTEDKIVVEQEDKEPLVEETVIEPVDEVPQVEEIIVEPEVEDQEEILLAEGEDVVDEELTSEDETALPDSPVSVPEPEPEPEPALPPLPVPDSVKEIEAQVDEADKNIAVNILLGRLTPSDIAALTALIVGGDISDEDVERAKDIIRGKVNEDEKDDLQELFDKYEHLLE